jgi:hypothetical protein
LANNTEGSQKKEEKSFDQQIDDLWKGKDDKIEDTKQALLNHYTAQQNGQVTRLVGFVIGLFTLLQLAQGLVDKAFNKIFSAFPSLIQFPMPWEGDVLKTLFLFFGTWIILYFILRSISRFAVFGKMVSYAMWVTKEGAKDIVSVYAKKWNVKPMEFENRRIWVLNEAVSEKVYHEPIYWKLRARWFLRFDMPECPSCERVGYYLTFGFAFLLAFLLLLFLW